MWSSLISLNLEKKKAFAESSELKSRSPKVWLPFVCRSLLLTLAILGEMCEVPGCRRKPNRSNHSIQKMELLDTMRLSRSTYHDGCCRVGAVHAPWGHWICVALWWATTGTHRNQLSLSIFKTMKDDAKEEFSS